MNNYTTSLTGLLSLCAALYAAQARGTVAGPHNTAQKDIGTASFLVVYTLVMAADWLQGPYLYALYAEEHGVAAAGIRALFAIGFIAGGLSASVVGAAADYYGRRRACLACCMTSALSCLLTIASARLPVLLAGRVLGGISTSLLFSVFESWLVTDYCYRTSTDSAAALAHVFGRMGTLNSLAAISAGVLSDWAVQATGTRRTPFVMSIVLLAVAAWRIATTWTENYGEIARETTRNEKRVAIGVWTVLRTPPVLVLCLASTLFEGSMYLFVFFWTPALQAATAAAVATAVATADTLPCGIIFACFMAAAMAATLAFNMVTAATATVRVRCTTLLLALLVTAAVVFYRLSSPSATPATAFWLFCLFEACVGTYWPCIGALRGQLVPDGTRAQVYALLRVPLNVFVVTALMLMPQGGGDSAAVAARVFGVCSMLLLAAVAAVLALLLHKKHLP